MDTELKTGRLRFVVSGSDQRLVHAVLNRFVDWWDASGHKDLVASNDIVPLPDVTWNANAASITLPVYFESPVAAEPPTSFEILSFLPSEGDPVQSTREPGLSIEPETSGVVGSARPTAEADDRGSPEALVFEIVDDVSDAALMQFPSEADPPQPIEIANMATATRPRRARAGGIVRVCRRVKAGAAMVATRLLRIVLLPWLLTAQAVSSCYRFASYGIVFVGRGALAVGAVCGSVLWRVVTLPWSLSVRAAGDSYRYARRILPRAGRGAIAVGTVCAVALWRVVTLAWSLSLTAVGGCYRYARRILPRAGRGAIAVGSVGAVALWRAVTLPWSLSVRAVSDSYRYACRVLPRVASVPARIAAPRLIARAAVVSTVLAVAITAAIAWPSRIVSVATTPEPATAIAANRVEPAALPSRSLAMFVAPSLRAPVPVVSSVPVGTSYTRATRTASQKREALAARAERRQAANRQRKKPTPAVAQIASVKLDYLGSLMVVSEPSGATVRIDGRTVGTTPLQLNDVRVGSHAIHVALDGYPVWSTAATVVYGKSNGVVARLGR